MLNILKYLSILTIICIKYENYYIILLFLKKNLLKFYLTNYLKKSRNEGNFLGIIHCTNYL